MFYKYIWIGRKKISIRKRWLKKIEKKNVTIAVKVLNAKKENIYPVYVSKKNSNKEKQDIILLISNRERLRNYLGLKKLSALLSRINSKHHGDFYCLNCLHSFATWKQLESNKEFVKI